MNQEYKLVPVEPTEEMLITLGGSANGFFMVRPELYKAMLNAAPQPASPAECPSCHHQGSLSDFVFDANNERATPEQEPVACVYISHHKGGENRDFDYWGDLPAGTHNLYTHAKECKQCEELEALGKIIMLPEMEKAERIATLEARNKTLETENECLSSSCEAVTSKLQRAEKVINLATDELIFNHSGNAREKALSAIAEYRKEVK